MKDLCKMTQSEFEDALDYLDDDEQPRAVSAYENESACLRDDAMMDFAMSCAAERSPY